MKTPLISIRVGDRLLWFHTSHGESLHCLSCWLPPRRTCTGTHLTQGGCDTRNCACVCWGGGPSFRFPPWLYFEATPVILVSFPDQLNRLFLRSQRIPMYKDSIYYWNIPCLKYLKAESAPCLYCPPSSVVLKFMQKMEFPPKLACPPTFENTAVMLLQGDISWSSTAIWKHSQRRDCLQQAFQRFSAI